MATLPRRSVTVNTCLDCGLVAEVFGRGKKSLRCTDCRFVWKKLRAREWYLAHRDETIARTKAFSLANPGRMAGHHRRQKLKHPARYLKAMRKSALSRYGLTIADYRDMLVGQAGRCLICLQVPVSDLVVDHDHATGVVRGLLCSACNSALGMLRDDTTRLSSAIRYLGLTA